MLLTIKDVAERFQVTQRTVWRWVESGKLKSVRLTPQLIRFRLAEVIKMEQRSSH